MPEHVYETKGKLFTVRVKFIEPDPFSPEGCNFCEVMPPNHRSHCPRFAEPKWYQRWGKTIRNFFFYTPEEVLLKEHWRRRKSLRDWQQGQ
jgi:hypothetical protein